MMAVRQGNSGLSQGQRIFGSGALISYGLGYPMALWLHSAVGWALVMVGGLFLLGFGVATIRWAQRR